MKKYEIVLQLVQYLYKDTTESMSKLPSVPLEQIGKTKRITSEPGEKAKILVIKAGMDAGYNLT